MLKPKAEFYFVITITIPAYSWREGEEKQIGNVYPQGSFTVKKQAIS